MTSISGSPGAREQATPLYVTFDNNALLATLFGDHDEHLARLEQGLGVWTASRGNRVAISGAPGAAAMAREVLLELYRMIERGLPVGRAEVDAAIRLAKDRAHMPDDDKATAETVIRTQKRQILARSANQAAYINALNSKPLVYGIGPAGTGKTYLAVAVAAALLARGQIDRIILSRPAVVAGEKLGFLPGDLREKVDPYLRPLYDALFDMMPSDKVVARLQSGEIEVAPLAFMRGRTLSNACVILDEAQNATAGQMKMFLTRLGDNSRMAATGDPSQTDLPAGARSGLKDALEVTAQLEGVAVIRFTDADVVRHPLVTRIVRAYDARDRLRADRAAGTADDSDAAEADGQ